jgi:hypothetical protein
MKSVDTYNDDLRTIVAALIGRCEVYPDGAFLLPMAIRENIVATATYMADMLQAERRKRMTQPE